MSNRLDGLTRYGIGRHYNRPFEPLEPRKDGPWLKVEDVRALLEWVPVSERLPEKEGRYDVTVFFPGANKKPWVSTGDFTLEHGFGQDEIIAWKERAEPYIPEPPRPLL